MILPHPQPSTVFHSWPQKGQIHHLSTLKTSSDQQLPGYPLQHHPPGCDEVQQPVYPDLLNATVRYSTYVGKVQLLVPAKVVQVGQVVRQWGARDRTKK